MDSLINSNVEEAESLSEAAIYETLLTPSLFDCYRKRDSCESDLLSIVDTGQYRVIHEWSSAYLNDTILKVRG